MLFGVTVAVVSSFGGATAAPVPKHLAKEAEGGDKAKLQGKWKLESMKMGDKNGLPDGITLEMTLEIKDDKFTMQMNVAGMSMTGTATLAYGKDGKRELTMTDMKVTNADGTPAPTTGTKEQSIGFEFDGEKLLMGSTSGGDSKAIDPLKPGANDMVMTLTRIKDK